MMDDIKAIATERDNLIQLLGELRTILCTPEDVDVCEHARQVTAKAAKWDGVPWETIDTVIYYGLNSYNSDDELIDLRTWYDANKPDGAA